MIIWIFFISVVCTLIYSVIAHDYLMHDAMWDECLFPGVVVWNKLEEEGFGRFSKILISSVLSIVLFAYTVTMFVFCISYLIIYALEGFVKRIRKKK